MDHRSGSAVSTLVAFMLAAQVPVVAAEGVAVARGTPPEIDGTVEDAEWRDASVLELSSGGRLWLMHAAGSLYLGLRGERGLGSLCILAGASIHVLHASSALGTAIYERGAGERWSPSAGFEWSLRETDSGPETLAKRARFYDTHGWVASNMDTGTPGEMEFRIALDRFGGPTPRLAVTYTSLGDDGLRTETWPTDLDDFCRDPELVRGDAPASGRFDPDRWAELSLGP